MDLATQEQRYLAIRNVTWLGILINILLSLLKLIGGTLGQSQALIADGLHSLADLISDGVVLVAAHYSNKTADAHYPYGYGRFETLASVFIGGSLLLLAIAMLLDASSRLWNSERLLQPTILSVVIVILAILAKEALYQFTRQVANQVQSHMLQLHAWHHRTDSISSLVVLVGIAGSMLGLRWLDAIAAIGVSFMIAKVGLSLGWNSLRELADSGLSHQELTRLQQIIQQVDGVHTLHELRTRRMGAKILIDVHLLVNPLMSVSEGHQIGEAVRARLMDEFTADVLIHIDAENDEQQPANLDLPLRSEVLTRLQQRWSGAAAIDQITLHYLNGKLTVDIYLPLTLIKDLHAAETLTQHLTDLATQDPDIYAARIFYH